LEIRKNYSEYLINYKKPLRSFNPPLLEHDNGITFQIRHIHILEQFLLYLRLGDNSPDKQMEYKREPRSHKVADEGELYRNPVNE